MNMDDPAHQANQDRLFWDDIGALMKDDRSTWKDRWNTFPKYISLSALNNFMARAILFEHILTKPGAIIEGGVGDGFGLFTWGKLSALYEPYHHARRVYGFDSFQGFPSTGEQDKAQAGQMRGSSKNEIEKAIQAYDRLRPIGHVPRIELIEGRAEETIPQFIIDRPHVLIALLYLDFDLYAPTVAALTHLLPRVASGGIVAFDELNCANWPGETQALIDTIGVQRKKWMRVLSHPRICYFEIE